MRSNVLKADIPVENYQGQPHSLWEAKGENLKVQNEKINNNDQTISLSAQILRINWKLCLNLQS